MTRDSKKWKHDLYIIIFESDTPKGKAFDVALIISILFSCIIVLLDSVEAINSEYGLILSALEWIFMIIFTLEYILRIICVEDRFRYLTSFFGIIDLMAILPTLISLFFPAGQFLMIVRILRLFRLFRVFKMSRYIKESTVLLKALKVSFPKIIIFIFTMFFIAMLVGSLMYIIEGPENGYTSIPQSMYWAIVTVTTVGYGDISPQTTLGKIVASVLMISSYGILAVPTGIVTFELAQLSKKPSSEKEPEITCEMENSKICPFCSYQDNAKNAVYCNQCGKLL
jgi:voltage-gated potassium channel